MSIKFFDICVPVMVCELDASMNESSHREHRLTVRITMGPSATAKDAVDALARKLEETCNTIDIGDET